MDFNGQCHPSRWRLFFLIISMVLILSLTSCAQVGGGGAGNKELSGTGVGALIGGVAGALLGKGSGKTTAIIAGLAIGGLIGNRIGAMLDKEDQKALQAQTQKVLYNQPDNSQTQWESQHSGAKAVIVPQNTRIEKRQVKIIRAADVAPAPALDVIDAKYLTRKKTTVRKAPNNTASAVKTLPAKQNIWAIGKVKDQPWIMVAQGGKSIGYVKASSISPVPAHQIPKASPNNVAKSSVKSTNTAPSPFDLDSTAPVRTASDLDALGPGEQTDVIVASVTCRDIKTRTTAKGQTADTTQTLCKSPDGSWELN